MKNVQPAPEHVRAELVQGKLLHGGRRPIRKPSLRVLKNGVFVGSKSWDIEEGEGSVIYYTLCRAAEYCPNHSHHIPA